MKLRLLSAFASHRHVFSRPLSGDPPTAAIAGESDFLTWPRTEQKGKSEINLAKSLKTFHWRAFLYHVLLGIWSCPFLLYVI